MTSLPDLLPPTYKPLITTWLSEDLPPLDPGSYVVGTSPTTAHLYCKSPGVLAGVPFFDEVFHQLACTVEWHYAEGTFLDPAHPPTATSPPPQQPPQNQKTPRILTATLRGPTSSLLQGERTALNILSRTSGIASATRSLTTLLRNTGYTGTVAGTRKTTPGFRLPEKYAMLVGGGDSHRYGLGGMVMLKDNHVRAWRAAAGSEEGGEGKGKGTEGGISGAVAAARRVAGFSVKIEVEVGSVAEAEEAVEAGAEVVMLDNFDFKVVGSVARGLKERFPGWGGLVEVSGGVTAEGVQNGGWDLRGVDVVSSSAVHQGVGVVDFSLKVV